MQSREKWLLSVLTGIFIVQAGVLVYGVRICSTVKPQADIQNVCPELGARFENTFGTMIATTLALLTGSTVAAAATRTRPPKPTPKND